MRLAVLPEYPLPGVAPYGFSLPPRPWLKARAGGLPPGRLPRCVGSLRGSPLVGFGPSSECLRQPAAALSPAAASVGLHAPTTFSATAIVANGVPRPSLSAWGFLTSLASCGSRGLSRLFRRESFLGLSLRSLSPRRGRGFFRHRSPCIPSGTLRRRPPKRTPQRKPPVSRCFSQAGILASMPED